MTKPDTEKNVVVLSNGTVVTFEKEMTHEAEVARRDKMYEGVMLQSDGEGGFKTDGIPFKNYVGATDACLPLLIKKIEIGGTEMQYTDAWRKKLTERDFKKLKAHIDDMVAEASVVIEEGKKNS